MYYTYECNWSGSGIIMCALRIYLYIWTVIGKRDCGNKRAIAGPKPGWDTTPPPECVLLCPHLHSLVPLLCKQTKSHVTGHKYWAVFLLRLGFPPLNISRILATGLLQVALCRQSIFTRYFPVPMEIGPAVMGHVHSTIDNLGVTAFSTIECKIPSTTATMTSVQSGGASVCHE